MYLDWLDMPLVLRWAFFSHYLSEWYTGVLTDELIRCLGFALKSPEDSGKEGQ